eukprot:UN11470
MSKYRVNQTHVTESRNDNKPSQESITEIVEKAMHDHHRRKSQFIAIQNDLGLIFDKDDVAKISKNVMKKIFAQKHNKQQYYQNDTLEKGYHDHLKHTIEHMQIQITEKEKEIEQMKHQIINLTNSKNALALNTNKCLNEMRGYLLLYQQSINSNSL